MCLAWIFVNVLTHVDVYVGVHPTQEQLQGLHAYGRFRQIVLLSGIAVIIAVGIAGASRVAKRHRPRMNLDR